jgi:ribonuclease Z
VDTLIRAGKNSTLLIHEATMAGDQEDLANSKAHSTFNQAITVGNKCAMLSSFWIILIVL